MTEGVAKLEIQHQDAPTFAPRRAISGVLIVIARVVSSSQCNQPRAF